MLVPLPPSTPIQIHIEIYNLDSLRDGFVRWSDAGPDLSSTIKQKLMRDFFVVVLPFWVVFSLLWCTQCGVTFHTVTVPSSVPES